MCQPALEQGYEIENVAATEGIDFLCVNLHNLSLQNYRLREGTGIWVTTCMQYLLVFETD